MLPAWMAVLVDSRWPLMAAGENNSGLRNITVVRIVARCTDIIDEPASSAGCTLPSTDACSTSG